jgi:Flp pilus assembly protein TadG
MSRTLSNSRLIQITCRSLSSLSRFLRFGAVGFQRRRIESCRMSGEEGDTIAEFALSSTILIAIVFGIFETSSALYSYTYISDAAREGVRYAIVRGSACTGFSECLSTPVGATSAQVQAYVKSLGYPGITSNNLTVTTTWPTTGSACTPIASPCNNPGNLAKVVVAYKYPLSIPFVPWTTISMSSTSEMIISQ